MNKNWDNKILFTMSTLLGFSHIDELYRPMLNKFMSLKSNWGFLGG